MQSQKEHAEKVIKKWKKKVQLQDKQITALEQINDGLSKSEVTVFQEGAYSEELRICALALLEKGLSARDSVAAIETVMKKLAGVTLNRVPTDRWISRVLLEADLILSRQLTEKIQSEKHITLATDNATHSNVGYMGSQLHYQDGTRQTIGKSTFGDAIGHNLGFATWAYD